MLDAPERRIKESKVGTNAWLSAKVQAEAPANPETETLGASLRHMAKSMFGRGGRWLLVLLVAQATASIVIPSLPFLPGEQSHFAALNQQQQAAFAGLSNFGVFEKIFVNNMGGALLNLIPGIGVLSLVSSTYVTARIVQVAAAAAGQWPPSLYSGSYFLFPHTWIELSGYSIAVFEAFQIASLLFKGARKRGFARAMTTQIAASLCLVTLVILVAAAFEEGEYVVGLWGLLAWIPFGFIVLGIFRISRMLKGDAVENPGSSVKKLLHHKIELRP